MPRGDRTGPAGMGPMTGRGLGCCAGFTAPAAYGTGRGFGYGRGFGMCRDARLHRRMRFGFAGNAGTYGQDDKVFLKDRVAFLEAELLRVKAHLKDLEEDE